MISGVKGNEPDELAAVVGQTASLAKARVRRCVARFVLQCRAVTRSIHVRLDDASVAALEIVRASGMSDSQAVRTALREAAARRRARSALHEEVLRVAADDADREEMRIIREQMADLAPGSVA